MKRLVLFICWVAMVSGVRAVREYRDFTSAEGKTIRGAVVAYDAATKTVTVERDNKRTSTVPITLFCDADQTYILEWDAAKGFMSDGTFKISCDKKRVNQRTEEQFGDVRDEDGNIENIMLKKTSYESLIFEVELYNMNSSDLKDIRMEYVVYYEQSEESWERPQAKQEIVGEKISVPLVAARKRTTVPTKSVEIYKENIAPQSWVSGKNRTGGSGKVHGMRARLYTTLPSGKELMREFCFPEKLSEEKFPWKG